ncbi:abortive infection family protein [Myxococcota bacterium]|nr:abortive infection family protein [Myxococcota bacterium]MBU1382872.1 abortive infection family protein [Myxococcota bacterium]MBU1496678.1 abortive infection family protein [Myxococcota bacterium]
MKKEIPAPLIAVIVDHLPELESHVKINSLFKYADAPGEPPEGTKGLKTQEWLRRINKESDNPLSILGKLIEPYMEIPDEELKSWGIQSPNFGKLIFKEKLTSTLARCNLQYIPGGIISDGCSSPSMSLKEMILARNIPSIEFEFQRALTNVNSEPREAVSAACNILESTFKVYIADEGLEMPQKQDLQSVWKVVRSNLGFDPSNVEDDDLKKILSGILSVVDGIGSLRTHASSAHGQGRKTYNLMPRHARLAIHSAHTLTIFVLETWDEKKNKG